MIGKGLAAKVKFAVVAAAVVLALIVAFQNTEIMVVRVLFWRLIMAKTVVLFAVFVAGGIAGALTGVAVRSRRK